MLPCLGTQYANGRQCCHGRQPASRRRVDLTLPPHSGVTSPTGGNEAMTDLESLSRRLQTLEGRFRMMKAVAVITCLIVSGHLVMWQGPSPLPARASTIQPLDPFA